MDVLARNHRGETVIYIFYFSYLCWSKFSVLILEKCIPSPSSAHYNSNRFNTRIKPHSHFELSQGSFCYKFRKKAMVKHFSLKFASYLHKYLLLNNSFKKIAHRTKCYQCRARFRSHVLVRTFRGIKIFNMMRSFISFSALKQKKEDAWRSSLDKCNKRGDLCQITETVLY